MKNLFTNVIGVCCFLIMISLLATTNLKATGYSDFANALSPTLDATKALVDGKIEDSSISALPVDCTPANFTFTAVTNCEDETYSISAYLEDFGGNFNVTVYFTRSDGVSVNPATLIFALEGETINILNNIPFGVTVDLVVSVNDPLCDVLVTVAQEYCHIPGEVCTDALIVSELPFSASGNTSLYLDDYSAADVPPLAPNAITTGSAGTYYLDGDDVVFAYTPDADGAIDILATSTGTYQSLYAFTGCPFASTLGYHNDFATGNRAIDHMPVVGGTTYYIVISSWPAPQSVPFTLSITPWEDCTGTPTAGIASAGAMVCAATAFDVVSTGATPDANGLIFTWQSSPTGAGTWADVAGANTPTSTIAAGINEDTDFRLKAYCTASDETDYSNIITFTVNPNYTECYCIPTYTYDCGSGDDLSNVTLIGESVELNNTTECSTDGYADFTDLPAVDLAPGETYSLSASTTYSFPASEQVKAWIDFNLNGAFEADEAILNTNGAGLPSSGTGTFSFTMPEGLDAGNYRLRVRLVYGSSPFTACDNQSFGETQDYMVEILDLDACSGTPEAGTAANDAISICPSIPFTLSVSGSSEPANGLVRAWQSSPSGANTWTNIAGATSTTYSVTAGITEPKDFRYSVLCTNGNASDYSNVIVVSFNPANECYCTPTYSTGCDVGDDLSNVTLTGESVEINNTTDCLEGYYGDFTDLPAADLAPGETYSLSASTTYSSPTSEQVKAWIDFNQNGGFEESELIANSNGAGLPGGTGTFDFTVPEGLDAGNYRLRVRLVYAFGAATFTACDNQTYGETQDYMVEIIELTACSGTPEAGTADNNNLGVCANIPFTVSVSGSSDPADGLSRVWQSSPAGANTWNDIAGETSTSYTVDAGINTPTDYRYRVVCENGNLSDVSNVIEVSLNPALECYCIPSNTVSADYYISSVSTNNALQDLDRNSGFTAGGYADYTETDTLIAYAGQEFDFSLVFGTYSSRVGVWVDFNQNGSFAEANENIILTTSYSAFYDGTILVPAELADGSYRIRIRTVSGTPSPCGVLNYSEAEDYVLKVITLNECAGTPEGGTATGGDFTICPTNEFSLVVQGATSPADGLERIWQSSPAGENNWTDIPEATSTTYNVEGGVSADTDFRYRVTCTNSQETDYSNVIEVTINTNVTECYCIPVGTSPNYYINNFTTTGGVSNISNLASGYSPNGYGDFTSTMTVSQVQTQSVSFTEDFVSGTAGFRIWVDWNQDGAFDIVNELAWNSTNYSATHSGSFTVPQTALAGTTRMRVVAHYLNSQGLIDPCGSFSYGEFEDYAFEVLALEECAGTPEAGVAAGDQFICPNNMFTLSVTGASDPATGLDRNWQSSPAGAGVWTNIAGATSTTYVVAAGVSEDTDFRYAVTCANSQETDYSNVIEVTINTNVTECYCIPTTTGNTSYINLFTATGDGVQDISNASGSSLDGSGYSDYTNLPALTASAGGVIDFTATAISGGGAGLKIWVDWSQNGSFLDVGEVVFATTTYANAFSGSFTVPANASGTYRLRVADSYIPGGGPDSPCDLPYSGEYEDYILTVSATSAVSLSGSVIWNSSCGNRAGTVKLYTPGTATLIETYDITVGATGAFSIPTLPIGTYDVIVKVQGYLAKGIQDVAIVAGENILSVGAIRNGNINNDGAINIFDVSLINAAFNKSVGNPGYNPLADLNCDGNINIFDISILNASFNQSGATAPLN